MISPGSPLATFPRPIAYRHHATREEGADGPARGETLTAIKRHPRSAPDAIVRRLYALRHDPESPFIRAEADLTLGEVLALEGV
ncbi:MAG TPA: hypothetical protein VF725_02085 [Ktedonobacterales bacterium]